MTPARRSRRGAAALAFALAAAGASACASSGGGPGTGSGGGSGTAAGADCEAARPHVTKLYADALAADPKLGDTLVADGTALVMAECAREPGRVAPCAAQATSARALETTCLVPLDDDGTEGDRFR